MSLEKFEFVIDGKPISLEATGSPPLEYGQFETLSNEKTDITFGQKWYPEGFNVYPFLKEKEFSFLLSGISERVQDILSKLGADTTAFDLTKYHHFLQNEDMHFNVTRITRDLFPEDFNFSITENIQIFEKLLGFELTDIDSHNGKRLHIILRINRPKSRDFNPPHKDIYEGWDNESYIPRFVNFWIPICGVTSESSLPLVPRSHLIPENKLLRTFSGGVLEGNKYRVRNIVRWDGRNDLYRAEVQGGEVLVFSSHLIHGCAINDQADTTRVALEFRLFKK